MSERQRESLSQKPVSLGGIVLSCAFLGDYGSLSVSLSSRPSVTQQHLTSREKTESVVKSNGLPPSPPSSTQFPICRVPLSSSTPNKTSVLPPKESEEWQFIVGSGEADASRRFRSGKASAFKMSWFSFPRFDYRISKSCLAKL